MPALSASSTPHAASIAFIKTKYCDQKKCGDIDLIMYGDVVIIFIAVLCIETS